MIKLKSPDLKRDKANFVDFLVNWCFVMANVLKKIDRIYSLTHIHICKPPLIEKERKGKKMKEMKRTEIR